ncbi:hypothetical protein A0257_21300 [Hymenobacter psoromatis]|nr:hypothetical protein A0257_21300 [Hymenobacter psoromatis]
MTKPTAGRWLFTLNALITGTGGFLADFNATHVYNPRWPPHAKFHNGQTMAVGVLLAGASLFFTWRRAGDRQTNVLAAALSAGSLFWSQAAANLFPGAAWTDPELLGPGQSMDQFPPQLYIDLGMTTLVLLATWLSWPRTPAAAPELTAG